MMGRIEAHRVIDGLAVTVGALIMLAFYTPSSRANDKPAPAAQQSQTQTQTQTQTQSQSTASESSSVSGGGHSSANLYDGTTTRTIAVGTTSPAPLHATPSCYLPAKGIRRVRQALFGVVTLDPRLVRDELCMADLAIARSHELAVLQAETQLEWARNTRLSTERQDSCNVAADRAIEACGAK